MSQELFFTSAPRGLKPGSKGGFCTVAATASMSPPLADRLESLSGYKAMFPMGDPRWNENPVSHAHWRVSIGGRALSVLSRVSAAPADYSGRSNKFAHHLVLDSSELPAAGPAWTMMQAGVMESHWEGEPRVLPSGRRIPQGDGAPRVCERWQASAGDAGWAGVLAESFLLDASKPAYIIYPAGTDLLPLIDEAIALLPAQSRWQVTFNTYFLDLPAGLSCSWRGCVAGTPAAKDAPRNATSGVVIDLTQPRPLTKESRYITAARTGSVSMSPSVAQAGLRLAVPAAAEPQFRDEPEQVPAKKRAREMPVAPPASRPPSWAAAAPSAGVSSGYSSTQSLSPRARFPWIIVAAAIIWAALVPAAFWFFWVQPSSIQLNMLRAENESLHKRLDVAPPVVEGWAAG